MGKKTKKNIKKRTGKKNATSNTSNVKNTVESVTTAATDAAVVASCPSTDSPEAVVFLDSVTKITTETSHHQGLSNKENADNKNITSEDVASEENVTSKPTIDVSALASEMNELVTPTHATQPQLNVESLLRKMSHDNVEGADLDMLVDALTTTTTTDEEPVVETILQSTTDLPACSDTVVVTETAAPVDVSPVKVVPSSKQSAYVESPEVFSDESEVQGTASTRSTVNGEPTPLVEILQSTTDRPASSDTVEGSETAAPVDGSPVNIVSTSKRSVYMESQEVFPDESVVQGTASTVNGEPSTVGEMLQSTTAIPASSDTVAVTETAAPVDVSPTNVVSTSKRSVYMESPEVFPDEAVVQGTAGTVNGEPSPISVVDGDEPLVEVVLACAAPKQQDDIWNKNIRDVVGVQPAVLDVTPIKAARTLDAPDPDELSDTKQECTCIVM